jgi:hypothetical protein
MMDAAAAELVTNCGRRLVAGRFRIPATPGIERVVLRVDSDGRCETVWASLTADEAMALAGALIAQARAVRARAAR